MMDVVVVDGVSSAGALDVVLIIEVVDDSITEVVDDTFAVVVVVRVSSAAALAMLEFNGALVPAIAAALLSSPAKNSNPINNKSDLPQCFMVTPLDHEMKYAMNNL